MDLNRLFQKILTYLKRPKSAIDHTHKYPEREREREREREEERERERERGQLIEKPLRFNHVLVFENCG